MKKKLIIGLATGIILSGLTGLAIAVDDETVQQIQEDATLAKSKADENAAEIQSLKGGLPEERNERVMADADLQDQIDALYMASSSTGVYLIDSNDIIVGLSIDHSVFNAKVLYEFYDEVSGENFSTILTMNKDGIEPVDISQRVNLYLYYTSNTCQGQAYMKPITHSQYWNGYATPRIGAAAIAPPGFPGGISYVSSPDYLGNRNTLWYADTTAEPLSINPVYIFKLYAYGYMCLSQTGVYGLYPAKSHDIESYHPPPYDIAY